MKSWIGAAALWLVGMTACSAPTDPLRPLDTDDTDLPKIAPLRVGSFNIDWLWGHYEGEYTPRNEVDYARISELLVQLDLDVLALQEIDGEKALALLTLPDEYEWVVGKSGWSQNLVVMVRTDRVSMASPRELSLPSSEWPSKDPLVVDITALEGDLAFTFVNVHHHPFDNAEDSAYRLRQATELHSYLTNELPSRTAAPFDTHVLIAGDFNDTFGGINPGYGSLEVFEQDPGYTFATRDTTDFTQIPYRSTIDHIVLSSALVGRYDNGCQVVAHDKQSPFNDYEGGYGGAQNISTHRPLFIELAVQ